MKKQKKIEIIVFIIAAVFNIVLCIYNILLIYNGGHKCN
jgi:hypothetical protein